MALTDRKILTFDVVGTLVDFEAGVINFFRPIFDKAGVEIEDALKQRLLTESRNSIRRICVNLNEIALLARRNGTQTVTSADWGHGSFFTGEPPRPRGLK